MAINKIIDPNAAINAYTQGTKTAGKSGGEGGVSFADFLQGKVQDSIDTFKAGETMQARAIEGKADINDVVQAVTDAELTLQTVVALRDRLVNAYQEIMRLPI